MATDKQYVESIAESARQLAGGDCDTSSYQMDVYEGVYHMLSKRVKVEPSDTQDEEDIRVKSILCGWYLGFYLMAIDCDLGGSLVDYCTSHAFNALEGYVIVSYDDVDAMLEDISSTASRALSPARLYEELASIGIS